MSKSKIIFCYHCNSHSKTIEPISLERIYLTKFHISGVCENCKLTKSKFIYLPQNECLPIFFIIPKRRIFLNNINLINHDIVNIYENIEKFIN
jgi:hypothetical protein